MNSLKLDSLFSVANKVALVTGATGHLGRVMAQALHANGAYVIGTGRHKPDNQDGIDLFLESDLSIVEDQNILCADDFLWDLNEAINRIGAIDILVNNSWDMSGASGFNISHGKGIDHVSYYSDTEWNNNLGFLLSAAKLTEYCGNHMKRMLGGSIINICTMYAEVAPSPLLYEDTPYMNPPGYSAAKAGLLAFTRYAASFWGRYGIRVNAICPGPFPKAITDENRDFIQRLNDRTCLRRTGRAEEIAGPLLFLSSDASSYVTGHALSVDGGWTII